ncbi:MAG: hypothetical protein SOV63_09640 [Pyramidobacter porci]|uniref:hypothetical protein n=1 Tax=Pyramidobacter porci TaxID=2605789 RepID=UPI002A758E17|nr:hypothetical protein [Pyramidobacter porci]MDY2649055.1 hypothetical protein [Pyramidobacter porci]
MEKRTKVCASALVPDICGGRGTPLAEKRPSPVLKGGALAAVALGLMLMKAVPGMAADTATGAGSGVAYGTGSNAPKAENVAIGKGAGISYSNGASNATGDIVVGNGANINNYASQGGSVAIGKNAKVENMAGGGEASFAFGQTTYSGNWLSSARIPADPTKVVGSVAIGDNTFARTGSTMIGSHNYKGELGDTTVDSASTRTDALNVYATTIGANSFSNGAFTTSTGVYNIISSEYNGGRLTNPVKNLGATINGALNSIESKTGSYYSGIANTVSGVANRTFNSNGALVYGAGNEITNSVTSLSSVPTDSGSSAKEFADKLRTAITASEGGGATLAIGGGNKADYTQKTAIIGVNNNVSGTSSVVSVYNSITGFKNTASNVQHVSVIGSENTVTDTKTALLLGDKRKLTSANHSIVLGSADAEKEITVSDAVLIGHNADVQKEGGVALGSGSLADRGAFTASTKGAFSDFELNGKTAGAVSVGTADKLRQIINVGDATEETDAVNLRQLKAVKSAADAAKVHYYSANSTKTGAGSNYDNDGAEAEDSIVLGISSSSKGINSTVLGNNNKLTGDKNGRNNSIVAGQNVEVKGAHNAVFGTDYNNDDHKLTKVFGEQNTVIGVGNLVGYTAEKDPSDPTKWIYTKNSSGSDQNVAVGLTNTVNGGSVVVGTSSVSDSLGTSVGHGNTIVGMDDGGGQKGIALGNDLTVKGEEALAVGNKSQAAADWTIAIGSKSSAEKETSIAMGYDSHARADYGVALGAFSVADTSRGEFGYDPSTGRKSTNTDKAWQSKLGALSIGDKTTGLTRQITNLAAGTNDTDAVNVAQLKAVQAASVEAAKTHYYSVNDRNG